MNLLNAIRLLDLRDDCIVHLVKRPEQLEAPYYSIKELRKRFDLRAIEVRRINPWHYKYTGDVNWEFIIERWEDITGCKDYSNPRNSSQRIRKQQAELRNLKLQLIANKKSV